MPEAVLVLVLGKACGMLSQQVKDSASLRMILRQHVEHLTHCQYSPAVGAAPEVGRMRIHILHPSVAEESLLLYPHTAGKLHHLSGCLVIVTLVTRIFSHVSHSRDTHEHIIKPYRILLRTQASEGTVSQTILLIYNIVCIVVYQRTERSLCTYPRQFCLYHRAAHCSRIVKGMRVYDAPDIGVYIFLLLIYLAKARCYV